jgi:hypothetical protein
MTAKVVMPIIDIAKAHRAPIMWPWAHVSVVSLPVTQDAIAPLGTLLVYMISTILLTLPAVVKPSLALTMSTLYYVFVAPLLSYLSNGGIVNEGDTDSMTITPCRSSSIAIMGTVVVMSLITSPYGMINMATMVCGG